MSRRNQTGMSESSDDSQGGFHPRWWSVLALRAIETGLIERWIGITTETHLLHAESTDQNQDLKAYVPIPYDLLIRYMRRLEPGAEDVVYEIGCGAGRALCVFARYPVKRCVGVEISPVLAGLARENSRGLRGRKAPIDVIEADASKVEYDDGTIFWLFDPFGARTMHDVIARVRESVERNPRTIRICYVHPAEDHVLQASGFLQRYRWDKVALTPYTFYNRLGASYWTNDLSRVEW